MAARLQGRAGTVIVGIVVGIIVGIIVRVHLVVRRHVDMMRVASAMVRCSCSR